MALIDRLVIALLVPGIKDSLGISDTQIGLVQGTAFAIFYALAGLPLGRLVDRTNRRNLLIVGLAGWSLGTLACGLAHNFTELFAARIMVGICQAMLGPASFSMVTDFCPPKDRGRVTAVLVSGGTIGASGSSIFGGVVLDYFSVHPSLKIPFTGSLAAWQSTLVLAGLLGLALAPLLFTIREPTRRKRPNGASINVLAFLAKHRAAIAPLYAAIVLDLMAGYAFASWFAVVLLRNNHMSAREVGLIIGATSLGGAIVAAVAGGFLSDWFALRDAQAGRLKLARVLMLAGAVALPAMLLTDRMVIVLSALAVFCTLTSVISSIAYTVIPELAPSEGRGQVLALFQFLAIIFGLGTAPTLVALIADHVLHDERQLPLSLLLVCTPALLLGVLFITIAVPQVRRLHGQLTATEHGG